MMEDVLEVDRTSTTIKAEQGFEWQKGAGRFVARGNVRVHRGHVMLNTDTLTVSSYAVKTPAELFWWRAVGNTRLAFSSGIFSGEIADYDVHEKILFLGGHPLHIETATETLTAHTGVEYREEQQSAVARGDVHVVTKEGSLLQLNIGIIFFQKTIQPILEKPLFIGEEIKFETDKEIICGERGIYSLDTSIAIIMNSVNIATHNVKMTGERAVVNTKNGLSRLYRALQNPKKPVRVGRQKRVKLLLLQGREKNSRKDYLKES